MGRRKKGINRNRMRICARVSSFDCCMTDAAQIFDSYDAGRLVFTWS